MPWSEYRMYLSNSPDRRAGPAAINWCPGSLDLGHPAAPGIIRMSDPPTVSRGVPVWVGSLGTVMRPLLSISCQFDPKHTNLIISSNERRLLSHLAARDI